MTLQQLKYILAISETGSMNKAAEQLYVSQPSLTSSVRELESEIGIKIFNRSGRGVTLTNDGTEFVQYAGQVIWQFDILSEKYTGKGKVKKKFGVSTQHYSFAVKAFVEMVKKFDTAKYEFAVRETKTAEIISDVATMRSEIGIIYLNDFNRKSIIKLLKSNGLEFHTLTKCSPYVYIWKGHPLAD
ncbi:MAG: LysR family transcriptional regulator, partial [Ruminococcus sp.]|nr:LysR family transcriptional regulator [Ruminococcus sp.]